MSGSKKEIAEISEKTLNVKSQFGGEEVIIIRKFKNDDSKEKNKFLLNKSNKIKRPFFEKETYIERLYNRSIEELEEHDKKIVAEAFRRNNILFKEKPISLWKFVKFLFGKYDPYKNIGKK